MTLLKFIYKHNLYLFDNNNNTNNNNTICKNISVAYIIFINKYVTRIREITKLIKSISYIGLREYWICSLANNFQ